ncbi:urease accessory protein UreF [Photobacterium damselae]|uniref:urease accessory protein UreF n=1 Tax=Photobacterium damselae TaxID=38293 RepID=UPI003D7DB4F3
MTMVKNNLYHLLQLCQFSDSAIPIGSFAFSNGLESAIQLNIVTDEDSLKQFILVAIKQSAYLDGVYVNHAYRLAKKADLNSLLALDKSYNSKRVGKELQQMSSRIGNKLASLFLNIQGSALLSEYLLLAKQQNVSVSHPIVHGIIFSELALSEQEAFAIYQYGCASMILSAAVRLMRIDHYQTQRVLFEVNQTVDEYYEKAKAMDITSTHSFAPVFDCLISHHVDAHVRMFMN